MPVSRMSDISGLLTLLGEALSAGRRVGLNRGRATAVATSSSMGGGCTRFDGAACACGSAAATTGASLSAGPSSYTIAAPKMTHPANNRVSVGLLIVSTLAGPLAGGSHRPRNRHRDG